MEMSKDPQAVGSDSEGKSGVDSTTEESNLRTQL